MQKDFWMIDFAGRTLWLAQNPASEFKEMLSFGQFG
jgi:hypothetical protein